MLKTRVRADVSIVVAPRSRDFATLRSWEAQLTKAVRAAERAQAAEETYARLEALRGQIPDRTISGLDVPQSSAPSEEPGDDRLRLRLDELLRRAAEVEDRDFAASLTARMKALVQEGTPARELALREIETDVARRVKAQRVCIRVRAEADQAILSIAHLDGATVDLVRAQVLDVRTQRDLEHVRAEVDHLLETAERAQDGAFVTEQASLILMEMGYAVDEPFEVIDDSPRVMIARRRDLPNHALQVQVNPANGTLLTSVIASNAASRSDDLAAEEATCVDALALPGELTARGVLAELVFHRGIGAVPVERTLAAPMAQKPAVLSKSERRSPKTMERRP